jgi:hypothetical protein
VNRPPCRGAGAALFHVVGKQVLSRGRRLEACLRRIYFRISRPKASRNLGGKMAALMVNYPLTMIKGTLATQFNSIRQADRMGCGTVTCGPGSPECR